MQSIITEETMTTIIETIIIEVITTMQPMTIIIIREVNIDHHKHLRGRLKASTKSKIMAILRNLLTTQT